MKSILSLAAATVMLAQAPALAGEMANGAQFTEVSPSIIMIGTPAPKVEAKAADKKFDGFAANFPVTALLDDPATAALSLDAIVGRKTGTGEESAASFATAMKDKPDAVEPVKAAVSAAVPATPEAPQMAVAPTPSPHPETVAAIPPVAMDEATSSIGDKASPAPVKLFEDEGIRTGN